MSDPLSVPQIAARQIELETILQTIPAMQKEMDEMEAAAELRLIKARVAASRTIPPIVDGVKMLADERRDRIILAVETEWHAYESAKIQAEYVRSLAKQTGAELISLQSRLKVAQASGVAHSRYGEA